MSFVGMHMNVNKLKLFWAWTRLEIVWIEYFCSARHSNFILGIIDCVNFQISLNYSVQKD